MRSLLSNISIRVVSDVWESVEAVRSTLDLMNQQQKTCSLVAFDGLSEAIDISQLMSFGKKLGAFVIKILITKRRRQEL